MQPAPFYDSAQLVPHALQELKEAVHYRFLLFQLVRRDLLTRYKRSFLGVAWTMLNPLGTMIILSVVFSHILAPKSTASYPAFILTGLMAWNFFNQTTNQAMSSLIWGGGLLHRIYVPRSSFGLSALGSGLVNMGLAFIPLLLVMVFVGVPIRLPILFLPIPVLFLAFFTLGLALAISTFAIYFPDVAEMYQVVITAWMYLTPVIYPESILPAKYQWILHINPMYYLIKLWRLPLYDGRWPTWGEVWPAGVIAIVTLLIGWYLFTSKSDEFAYRV